MTNYIITLTNGKSVEIGALNKQGAVIGAVRGGLLSRDESMEVDTVVEKLEPEVEE